MPTYYKLARPDGWDFHTGRTVNYRAAIGEIVQPPDADPRAELCSPGILHASQRAEDCFQGASIPCSLYEIEGTPVCADTTKAGFVEMRVLREIDPAAHFKWRYAEAVNPLNPLLLPLRLAPSAHDLVLLRRWASVWDSVWDSVWGVGDSVWASVRASWASVWDSVGGDSVVGDSVWASVRGDIVVGDSVWASVRASVWAYIGWIFAPVITDWEGVKHHKGQYPFMPTVRLWKRGLVPSYDGHLWRLHSGSKAQIVWQGKLK